MTTMVAEVYDALVSAGASDEKARAAASAVAGSNQAASKSDIIELKAELKSEFAEFRAEMSVFRSEMKAELATKAERTDVAVLKWAAGLLVAMLASLVAKAFF